MLSALVLIAAVSSQSALRLEAENARLEGATVTSERPGFSGTGYATGFTADKARAVWTLRAKAGIYHATVGFSTPQGNKGFELGVNGAKFGGMFPDSKGAFSSVPMGRVELKDGANEVSIERGWGYYDLDYVEFAPAPAPRPLKPVPARLANPKATRETRELFAYLRSIYGKQTLSGQYDLAEANYTRSKTGKYPAILGGDLMRYSPSFLKYGDAPTNLTESWIKAAKSGMVLTLSWHWNAPFGLLDTMRTSPNGETEDLRWYKGFYTSATTFDVQKAMSDERSEERKAILSDIDQIAVQLKKLSDAKVPVLWRPLHEAEGKWFWWGAKGPEACKWLWQTMFARLTEKHGLHNLIWVWNSPDMAWYPGDDTVDIMSCDLYPSDRSDPTSNTWESLLKNFDGRKMLGLAEFPGTPDVERMHRFGVRWLFFVSWTGPYGPKGDKEDQLKRVYNSPLTITEDELPWKK